MAIVRLTLGLAVLLAALIAVVLVKLVVGIAVLGAVAFGALYAANFVRALLRPTAVRAAESPSARQSWAGSPARVTVVTEAAGRQS